MKKYIILALLAISTMSVFAQVADSTKRKVYLQGAANFRDVGGYKTTDGRQVKWGKIYRSADLSKLTDADLVQLKSRKIAYDVDLRGKQEAQDAPDKLNPGMDYILCPAGSDSVSTIVRDLAAGKSGDSIMTAFYGSTRYFADRYKPFFGKLLELPEDKSLVFHCTAGKDRTGIGSALFLYTLGVPYNTIVEDYLASNYYRQSESAKSNIAMIATLHLNEKQAKSVTGVEKKYLDATFDAIKKQYGSVDNFLKNQIGLTDKDIAALKAKYLQ